MQPTLFRVFQKDQIPIVLLKPPGKTKNNAHFDSARGDSLFCGSREQDLGLLTRPTAPTPRVGAFPGKVPLLSTLVTATPSSYNEFDRVPFTASIVHIGHLWHIGLGFLKFSRILYNSDRFATKLCNFIIHIYIINLLVIRTVVCLCTPKNPDMSTPFLTWEIGSENIDIIRVYGDITIVPISS